MRLTKHHGFGNDFLIVLDEANRGSVETGPGLARRLCDRHLGVGADGLIHGRRSSDGSVDVEMVLHNSDGSRAEISGNGIRCLAQAVADHRGMEEGSLQVATDGGVRSVTVGPPEGSTRDASVDMGAATAGPPVPDAVAGLVGDAELITVSIGNPHLVVVPADPRPVDIVARGGELEAAFGQGINVHVVTARPSANQATIAVWERGAGATLACGSGASATAWALHRSQPSVSEYQIAMPGGTASVIVGDTVVLGGPTTLVAAVEVAEEEVTRG